MVTAPETQHRREKKRTAATPKTTQMLGSSMEDFTVATTTISYEGKAKALKIDRCPQQRNGGCSSKGVFRIAKYST